MKRLFALIMALAMLTTLFAAAATAETVTNKVAIDETEEADEAEAEADTAAFYFGLYNPSLSINDEVVLNLDGMLIELDLALSDAGFITLVLQGVVGENFDESLLFAAAQLDENGLTLWADGLSNNYGITAEWFESESGVDLSVFGDTEFYTFLESLIALSSLGEEFSTTRIELIEALIIGFGEMEDDGSYTLALSREDGAAIMDMIGETAEDMDEDIDAEIEFDGTAEIGDDGLTVSLAGTLYDTAADESYPFTLEYADNGVDADGELIVTDGGESTTFRLSHTGEGGASITDLTIWSNDDTEDSVVFTYSVHPDNNSSEVDYYFTVSVYGEEEFALTVCNDLGLADVSFSVSLEVEEEQLLSISYIGSNDEDYAYFWQTGALIVDLSDGDDELRFTTKLILGMDMDQTSESWSLDSTSFIDLETISDAEDEALENELNDILENALALLSEYQPELYALIE